MKVLRMPVVVFVVLAAVLIPALGASAAPANDNFADAQQLTGPVAAASVNNATATREVGEPNPTCSFGGVTVGHTVWYKITATVDRMAASTLGSGFDTVIAIYRQTGTDFTSLVQIGCNDDTVGAPAFLVLESTARATTVAGQTYYIQVGGWSAAVGTISLSVVG